MGQAIEEMEKIEITGFVRRQAWEEIQQRRIARTFTGAGVYNIPYLFTEPQEDGYEWLKVRLVLTLEQSVKNQKSDEE
ncbi:MAG: hypothetical protein NZ959_07160 [Armatimonadetes bacterium]|nr:hypothetical protein [Armatimonadota bacterium]MDW8120920.1 hypothetical protein [Armatimonadota bacterium]